MWSVVFDLSSGSFYGKEQVTEAVRYYYPSDYLNLIKINNVSETSYLLSVGATQESPLSDSILCEALVQMGVLQGWNI